MLQATVQRMENASYLHDTGTQLVLHAAVQNTLYGQHFNRLSPPREPRSVSFLHLSPGRDYLFSFYAARSRVMCLKIHTMNVAAQPAKTF